MSENLKHFHTAWDVDRNIVLEQEKLMLVRFSKFENDAESNYDHHIAVQLLDEMLANVAKRVRNYCVVYAVDTKAVTEFDTLYELHDPDDPYAIMFFFQNRHIKVDCGTGNNNRINFPIDEDDLINIIDVAYKQGRMGKDIGRSPKTFPHFARQ